MELCRRTVPPFYNLHLILPGKLNWIKIKDDFDSGLTFVTNNGSVFYFISNLNAPRGCPVRYNLDHPVRPPPDNRGSFCCRKRDLLPLSRSKQPPFSKMPLWLTKDTLSCNTCTTCKASYSSSLLNPRNNTLMKTTLRKASRLNGLVLRTQNRSNFPLAAVSRNTMLTPTNQKCSSAASGSPWSDVSTNTNFTTLETQMEMGILNIRLPQRSRERSHMALCPFGAKSL